MSIESENNKTYNTVISNEVNAEKLEETQDSQYINLNNGRSFKPTASMNTINSNPSPKIPRKQD